MKKTLSVLLSVLLVLGCVLAFAACGGKTEPTTAPADTDETTAAEADDTAAEGSDLEYIQGKGKLVVGITEYEPMDFKDDNGEWTGFDAEYARAVAEKLGVEVEFIEIDWDNKILELDNKSIDVVWNGMTLT